MLGRLRFDCINKECQEVQNATQEEVSAHIKQCRYGLYACPFKCYEKMPDDENSCEKIQGQKMSDHLENCPSFQEECKECGLLVLRSKKESHNCYDDLIKANNELKTKIEQTKEEYGYNINPRCSNQHLMKLNRGIVTSYGDAEPSCD